jgi:hypothetical protein
VVPQDFFNIEIIIDIYDTSEIRALLTNACEICTTRRSRAKFVNDALSDVHCTIFYLRPSRIKKKFLIEVKIDHCLHREFIIKKRGVMKKRVVSNENACGNEILISRKMDGISVSYSSGVDKV